MSAENFVKFVDEHLPNDGELQKTLDKYRDDEPNFTKAFVDAGKANGYDFTAEEVLEVMTADRPKDGELSDADLAAVAGGVSFGSTSFSTKRFKTSFPNIGDVNMGGTYMCCW